MIRLRTLGLALVAVFAMSAVGTASASAALPEFYICAKVATGQVGVYENSKCEIAGGGKEYVKVKPPWKHIAGTEWCAPGAPSEVGKFNSAECTTAGTGWFKVQSPAVNPLAFTSSKSTAANAVLTTVGGHVVTCTSLTNTGELTGPKTDTATITFDECTTEGFKCQSAGEAEGIIKLTALSKLVYIKKAAPKEVGIVLEPSVAGGLFVEFKCNTPIIKETIKVKGSVIAPITPINTWVVPPSEFALTYSQAAGVQKPTEYENEAGEKVKDILETKGEGLIAFGYEQSAESVVDDLLFKEAGEVSA